MRNKCIQILCKTAIYKLISNSVVEEKGDSTTERNHEFFHKKIEK